MIDRDRDYLIRLYNRIEDKRKILVLDTALSIMGQYNGNGETDVICQAMYRNLTKKEMKEYERNK